MARALHSNVDHQVNPILKEKTVVVWHSPRWVRLIGEGWRVVTIKGDLVTMRRERPLFSNETTSW